MTSISTVIGVEVIISVTQVVLVIIQYVPILQWRRVEYILGITLMTTLKVG